MGNAGLNIYTKWNGLIRSALEEDGVWSDWTTLGLPDPNKKVEAVILAKQGLVAAGLDIAAQTFLYLSGGDKIDFAPKVKDGERVGPEEVIAVMQAEAWVILAGERTALNFLQRLSGIATLTKEFVDRIAGSKARIVDTRKTTPCMRSIEKYAVRCGGGLNHRFGLNDGCLVKDNHIRLAGGITRAVDAIRKRIPHLLKIEVEAENLEQVQECLDLEIQAILLDNMPTTVMAQAVKMIKGRMMVEASGRINLDNVADVASTGVDLISVGALTHSAKAVDISLELQ
ncbi:carboxylating nicotinate-nucleotide diphosphorylase [bacterium]|nr:carboxylating nicotinate-nucleotide diphosphorylase [bacterium]